MDDMLSRSLSLAGTPSESRPSAAAPAAVHRLTGTQSPARYSKYSVSYLLSHFTSIWYYTQYSIFYCIGLPDVAVGMPEEAAGATGAGDPMSMSMTALGEAGKGHKMCISPPLAVTGVDTGAEGLAGLSTKSMFTVSSRSAELATSFSLSVSL